MANIKKFPVTHARRELNRRGKMSLNCIVSDRWIRVGDPHWTSPELGAPIEIDVMRAYSNATGGDRKLCSLVVTVDQLRALLAEIDRRAGPSQ
ncbi:hypothetical protein [Mesorhizobium sp.]|uniref:hypothetical protein n=1 Tax=Mesorhizobium sp. TaxID=1871066 RepID=UPI000FE71926|nr:hypothetical protein [Mesorhizobium sp.]RWQ66673.1 MAG: hypothetical protein EOS86_09700 [Mesorhizobium sp.]